MAKRMIREVKETLDGKTHTFECQYISGSPTEIAVLFEHSSAGQVEDVLLPPGTLSFGYFWADRKYNAYHWVDPSGSTLGVYFNICDSTSIETTEVRWRDLMVDVLLTPDGRCRVLDEHELPDDIDPFLLTMIHQVRDDIVHQRKHLLSDVEARTKTLLKLIQADQRSVDEPD